MQWERLPLSVEVFEGNTQDPKTFASQIQKAADRFGARDVTFVGDRGMIKSQQIEDLGEPGFHYITAITKPQIEALLRQDVLQMELFDEDLAEIETDENIRFVLRRNPVRAEEIANSRLDKLEALKRTVEDRNSYLAEHPKAEVPVAWRIAQERAAKLRISGWVTVSSQDADRRIEWTIDEEALAEEAKLDGCYVLKTDLSREAASKQVVHDRYKDLAKVWIFCSGPARGTATWRDAFHCVPAARTRRSGSLQSCVAWAACLPMGSVYPYGSVSRFQSVSRISRSRALTAASSTMFPGDDAAVCACHSFWKRKRSRKSTDQLSLRSGART